MKRLIKTIAAVSLIAALMFTAAACGGLPITQVAEAKTEDKTAVTVSSEDTKTPAPAPTPTTEPSTVPSSAAAELDPAKAKTGVDITEDTNAGLGEVEFDGVKYVPKQNVKNILLLGIDSDAERAKKSMGWRSDMIMLLSIDMDTNQITCTSIPRDTRAKVYHLDSNGKIASEVVEKLNHAYAYGGGPTNYSAENSMRCVEEFLECGELINIPISSYISIDFDGLPKLASELGGVPVVLDQSVPDVGKKGEEVVLEGNKVRKFLENRHDMDDGEWSRQAHEQAFVKSMANIIKEMGAVEAAPELYDSFMKFMRTNLTLDEVLEMAKALDGASIDEMKFNLMEEGAPEVIDGVWYYRASQNEVIHQMLDVMYDKE